jgi:hypothetical protein
MQATSKRDLAEGKAELKRDLAVVEAKPRAKIAETKAELVKWVVSAGILQTVIIAMLIVKLIPS